MKCRLCSRMSVITDPALCKKHFLIYFEKKVKNTIKRFDLVREGERICVACSGGKDSTTTLYLLKKFFGTVTAIAVDEGISGYREHTLVDLRRFCRKNNISLRIHSFKDEFGYTIDEIIKKTNKKPCTACGILRRYILNKHSRGFDKIATGHNMDDESQSIIMNFLKNNLSLSSRSGPKTGLVKDSRFVERVKPLYFCYEKEIAIYAFINDFGLSFNECRYVDTAFRLSVRNFLNQLEVLKKGTKRAIIGNFLKTLPRIRKYFLTDEKISYCSKCGEPSFNAICSSCQLVIELKE